MNISVARGDRPERPQRDRNASYEFDARKIYFGNLSWGMDHLDLQDLCGEFGSVEDSRKRSAGSSTDKTWTAGCCA